MVANARDFGYTFDDRTSGLGAVKIELDVKGIVALGTTASCTSMHPWFQAQFVASKTINWFQLFSGEFITEIRVRESAEGDRITALCLQTNMRKSQWYGSANGTNRTIAAPPGYHIHSIHGSNGDQACRNLGAYFVPLLLCEDAQDTSPWLVNSEIIGNTPFDPASHDHSASRVDVVAAIVVTFSEHLVGVELVSSVEYQRYLAVTDIPPGDGKTVLVLVEGELVIALRACVVDNRISAVQFDTTLRTTEWFGPLPDEETKIETRSVHAEPTATHIGGIFTMEGPDCIASIGVMFYKPPN